MKKEKILQKHGKNKQTGPRDGLGEQEDNGSLETASQVDSANKKLIVEK